ncbi:MAG: MauE/DoxX family redox-associated membrane protein [Pseudomonadota bacterium]
MIEKTKLVQIEFVARALMALILLTAGTSKFFSGGGFQAYYAGQFANEALRIQVPDFLITLYLGSIPFIEVALGIALLVTALKRYTIYAWYLFMASLLVGHYILQEWSEVNQMLGYFFLGMICHALPTRND